MVKSFRKKLLNALALTIGPFVGAMIIKFIYHSSKKRFHLHPDIPEQSVIFAFWHGDLLLQPYLYYRFREKPNANVMISDHFDGMIISKIMRYFSLGTIHGSSRRNPTRVLFQAIRTLKKGMDIGITPDGPRGPRHEVADGIIIIAQKTGTKIVTYSCVPSRYWQFNSWDKFTMPKPFCTLDFYASEAIDVSEMELDDAKQRVKESLMRHAV